MWPKLDPYVDKVRSICAERRDDGCFPQYKNNRLKTRFLLKEMNVREVKTPKKSPAARYIKESGYKSIDNVSRKVDFLSVFFRPKGGKFLEVFFAARRGEFFSDLTLSTYV